MVVPQGQGVPGTKGRRPMRCIRGRVHAAQQRQVLCCKDEPTCTAQTTRLHAFPTAQDGCGPDLDHDLVATTCAQLPTNTAGRPTAHRAAPRTCTEHMVLTTQRTASVRTHTELSASSVSM